MMSGSDQSIRLESNPSGAEIRRNSILLGVTPVELTFRRNQKAPEIEFYKEGYKPRTVILENRLDDYFWGNILLGGAIGSTTDDATGAMYQFSPGQYLITLEPAASPSGFDNKSWLENAQKLKEFVIISYRPLTADINKGEGEYLSSLLNLLEIPEISKAAVLTRLRFLSETSPNIPNFADRIIEDLASRPTPPTKAHSPKNDTETESAIEKLRTKALTE